MFIWLKNQRKVRYRTFQLRSKDGPDPAMGEKGIGKGLPSQGYTGGSVMHEDGQTMTKDWMHEYDKTYVFSNSKLERIFLTNVSNFFLTFF